MFRILLNFFSTKLMAILLLVYAFSMAIATFIEKIYSTDTAKSIVYESIWFELIMLLLIICFLCNIKKYNLHKKNKIGLLIFHISFIFIFFGGAISRYIGFEGLLPIRQGYMENRIISEKPYFKIKISEGNNSLSYNEKYLLSNLHYNYEGKFNFKNNIFKIKIINYIPNAKETFIENNIEGNNFIKIISSENGKRNETFLKSGEKVKIGKLFITLNNPLKNSINLFEKNKKLYIISPFDISFFKMMTKNKGILYNKKLYKIDLRTLYNIKGYNLVFPENVRKGNIKFISSNDNKNTKINAITAIISNNKNFKKITFLGGRENLNIGKYVFLNGKKINISYGSIIFKMPFSIRLNKFIVENYPGSESPSHFSSQVTIFDKKNIKNYNIFMNNVLNYKGYRFFQSGYDSDKKGTILSVNHDYYGTKISYLGYFLLILGMFLIFFSKNSHFRELYSSLKILSKKSFLIFFLFLMNIVKSNNLHDNFLKKISIDKICNSIKIPKKHAEKFGSILIEDGKGRIKPINTLSLEFLRKIYKKDHIGSFDSNQWLLSMNYDSWLLYIVKGSGLGWMQAPFIKMENSISKKFSEYYFNKQKSNYISLIKLFYLNKNTGKIKFIFENEYEEAFSKSPNKRSEYEKDLIKLNERLNIVLGIYQGSYFKIFPINNNNNNWKSWINKKYEIDNVGFNLLSNYFIALSNAQNSNTWKNADKYLDKIINYQNKYGYKIIPSFFKIKSEIIYNKLNIFYYVMIFYSLIGIIGLIILFLKLFINFKRKENKFNILFSFLLKLIFFFHTLGLIMRSYISGYAPWSNGYESIIFISWSIILIGLVTHYFTKNILINTISTLSSVILLGVAHSNIVDPEITSLVPVLKSYWLMIHVSIITSSYGFLITCSCIGFFVMILYIIKNYFHNKKYNYINNLILELTVINEIIMTIGLFLLTIGTFLGGVWANESWGRYWSWDPKETWAFISIIIYSFVLHMRLVPGLRGIFAFNLASILSISSIIMTYFGVNYYLSGLHSYAKGDPIIIPSWIYYTILIIFIISLTAYLKSKHLLKNK